jgi:RimJ/RimL family protein N-acetyltransferase
MRDINSQTRLLPNATPRLHFRLLNDSDAEFILALLNEPDWLKYIGDKNVHTLQDALVYIHTGPLAMFAQQGFCLSLVEAVQDSVPLGLCGLLQRESLQWPDIGFAFAKRYHGRGIAFEAATATLNHAKETLGLTKVAAITALSNEASMGLLYKLGFILQGKTELLGQNEPSNLFLKTL